MEISSIPLAKVGQVVIYLWACRAAKPPDAENVSLGSGALIAQRIAVEVQERLSMMQREGRLPAQETCDLIVCDR